MRKSLNKDPNLDVRKLSKKYFNGSKDFYALQNITFHAYPGDCLVLLGPSGSGKTTLFNCLIGYEQPSEGYIFFDKTNIVTLTKSERHNFLKKIVGKIYSHHNLINYLSVLENIFLRIQIVGGNVDLQYLDEILNILEIKNLKNIEVRNLNYLDYYLVSLCKELAFKPNYLFLDEPDCKLQTSDKIKFFEKVFYVTHNYKITTVFFTSDINVSVKSPKVIRMDSGKIV